MDTELTNIIERLTAKAAAKRDRTKAVADADYDADMESIRRLTALDDDTGDDATKVDERPAVRRPHRPTRAARKQTSATAQAKRVGGRKNGPTAAVREAIHRLGDGFTVETLAKAIGETQGVADVDRAPIYSALNKLAGNGEIERLPPTPDSAFSSYRAVSLRVIE